MSKASFSIDVRQVVASKTTLSAEEALKKVGIDHIDLPIQESASGVKTLTPIAGAFLGNARVHFTNGIVVNLGIMKSTREDSKDPIFMMAASIRKQEAQLTYGSDAMAATHVHVGNAFKSEKKGTDRSGNERAFVNQYYSVALPEATFDCIKQFVLGSLADVQITAPKIATVATAASAANAQ
jgi:hypothetical protein